MLTPAAIQYTWKQLFYRLGIEARGDALDIGGKKVRFAYQSLPSEMKTETGYSLLVQACPEGSFEDLMSGRVQQLVSLQKKDFLPTGKTDFPLEEIPVLLWGSASTEQFAEIQGKNLIIHADILAAAFFMLSRYEEVHSSRQDKHGRYPFEASVCSRYDLIEIPIVDLYALILKAWLEKLTGNQISTPHKFKFHFSHDIDFMYLSHPFNKWLDVVARDLLKMRFDFLANDIPSLFSSYKDDLYFKDVKRLVQMARDNGNKDVYYLLTTKPLFSRDGYSLKNRRSREFMKYLVESGASIGMHASYKSFDQPQLYLKEKELLDEALGCASSGVRQHYLRIRAPRTWRHMQAAGFKYDESFSFAEHEGFRCGTCFKYRIFDVEQDREMDIYELPLIVMDTSLRVYRKLSPQEGEAQIMKLANICRAVNGTFTMLWHNTCLSREWQAWGQHLPEIVNTLTEMSRSI